MWTTRRRAAALPGNGSERPVGHFRLGTNTVSCPFTGVNSDVFFRTGETGYRHVSLTEKTRFSGLAYPVILSKKLCCILIVTVL